MTELTPVADGIWRIHRPLGPLINIYLAGDLLIDAGRRQDTGRILAQTTGRQLAMLVLTHAHPDHQGAAKAVCEARNIPLACHEADVDAMAGRRPMSSNGSPIARLVARAWGGPAHPVDRVLREGDRLGDFEVIHAPGHSPGEIVLFRPGDRLAIVGDVIRNLSYATARAKLAEPPSFFNDDTARNRESIRRLAELRPSMLLPGHGPAVRDMDAFQRLAADLPR